MGSALRGLLERAHEARPFEFDRRELEPLWIEAANERLAERRAQIPVLDALADTAGIREITALEQLVPLLLSHAAYKSYPRAFLDKGRWDGLTRWLNTVAAQTIDGVDLTGVETQDDWMAALAAAGHPIYATSGTSGKSSFLPATPGDREFGMGCILRAMQWQFGLEPDQGNAVVVLASSAGSSRANEMYRKFAEAYGDPSRTWFLTDAPVRLQDLSRMATLSKAIADGTASPNEIAAFETDMADRRKEIDEDWERLADVVAGLEGQRVIIQGFWAQQWTLVERLRARGIQGIELDPTSLFGIGGGTKGVNLPEDYREQVFSFWGVGSDRESDGYGMSELSAPMPLIGDRYVIQPWIIPLVLNEEGTEVLAADTGQHEGRYAFLDLALEGRWGGVVTGDQVLADFDSPGLTIVKGSVRRYSDLRGGEDDRLTCAGTVDAFVRGFEAEAGR